MDAKDKNEIVGKVVKDVLERFAFMFTSDPDDEQKVNWSGEYLQAVIRFSGAAKGSFSMIAPVSLCTELSANVLGIDPEENADALAGDALGELINIICGELVVALFGNETVFDISVPALQQIDFAKCKNLAAESRQIPFLVDDLPVLVSLTIGE